MAEKQASEDAGVEHLRRSASSLGPAGVDQGAPHHHGDDADNSDRNRSSSLDGSEGRAACDPERLSHRTTRGSPPSSASPQKWSARDACAVSDCYQAALHLAVLVAEVEARRLTRQPPSADIATANSIRYCGAHQLHRRHQADACNIDPGLLCNGDRRRRASALLVVHGTGTAVRPAAASCRSPRAGIVPLIGRTPACSSGSEMQVGRAWEGGAASWQSGDAACWPRSTHGGRRPRRTGETVKRAAPARTPATGGCARHSDRRFRHSRTRARARSRVKPYPVIGFNNRMTKSRPPRIGGKEVNASQNWC